MKSKKCQSRNRPAKMSIYRRKNAHSPNQLEDKNTRGKKMMNFAKILRDSFGREIAGVGQRRWFCDGDNEREC